MEKGNKENTSDVIEAIISSHTPTSSYTPFQGSESALRRSSTQSYCRQAAGDGPGQLAKTLSEEPVAQPDKIVEKSEGGGNKNKVLSPF